MCLDGRATPIVIGGQPSVYYKIPNVRDSSDGNTDRHYAEHRLAALSV